MAIIKCPECGKDISDKADICIHCGYPIGSADLTEEMRQPKSKDEEVIEKLEKFQELCGYAELMIDHSKNILSALERISNTFSNDDDDDEWD